MNWTLIAGGIIACLTFTTWWQHGEIGDKQQKLVAAAKTLEDEKQANRQLLVHIQDIKELEGTLNAFKESQAKQNRQLKNDLARTLADDPCARQSVPVDTRRVQRADQQRANTDIRSMFAP